MSMIERYKKRGGFIQLVNLLETMGNDKREKFLSMIAQESPAWETAIKQKMMSIDRISNWPPAFLLEFMPQLPPQIIAFAMHPLTEEKRNLFMGPLPFGIKKKVEDAMKEKVPNGGEIASSHIKIINEVRNMVAQGKLKLDKCDPELIIPENIEDTLSSGGGMSMPSGHSAAEEAAIVHAAPAVAGAGGAVGHNSDELALLRRKIVALSQDNSRMQKELNEYKEKIAAIKTALSKVG